MASDDFIYMGIDPGLHMGVAAIYGSRAICGGYNIDKKDGGWWDDQIMSAILDMAYHAWQRMDKAHFENLKVVIEDVPLIPGHGAKSYRKLQHITAHIETALNGLGAEWSYLAPASWKLSAYGRGDAPKKKYGEQLCDRLDATILPLTTTSKRQDALDAMALAYCAQRQDQEVDNG